MGFLLLFLLPFQCALFPFIDKANDENTEEYRHRDKAEQTDVTKDNGPGE